MSETDNEPSTIELLKRILQLEQELSAVSANLARAITVFSDFDKLLMDHSKYLDNGLADASNRLQAVEFKLFPELAKDLADLRNLIGDDGDARINRLDKRTPFDPGTTGGTKD